MYVDRPLGCVQIGLTGFCQKDVEKGCVHIELTRFCQKGVELTKLANSCLTFERIYNKTHCSYQKRIRLIDLKKT